MNVTPLVDIVLVLLIIFMVTTSYIVRSQINVDLPRAASGESEMSTTLTFQVEQDGSYLLDGEDVTLATIGEVIGERTGGSEEVRAVIAADKRVEYRHVVSLIDTIKSNGLEKFALNIERKATGAK